jgi:hypothetical protein
MFWARRFSRTVCSRLFKVIENMPVGGYYIWPTVIIYIGKDQAEGGEIKAGASYFSLVSNIGEKAVAFVVEKRCSLLGESE